MGRLSSPTVSARCIADWFAGAMNNSEVPMGSIELLLSESNAPTTYENSLLGSHKVEQATAKNVENAILRWFDKADSHPKNSAIFYFCGHGLGRGPETHLVLQDFGNRQTHLMENTIYLEGLHLGMDQCRARNQCFIADCCRNVIDEILELYGQVGKTVIEPRVRASEYGDRIAPIFWATGRDQDAYGKRNNPSRFTEILLQALTGLGADDSDSSGQWVVDTFSLGHGMSVLFDWDNKKGGRPPQKCKMGGEAGRFPIHYLTDALNVPVTIGCDPKSANTIAKLEVQNGSSVSQREPKPDDWETELRANTNYQITATFSNGAYRTRPEELLVRPPIREKRLRVEP
jgi:hypothetical protein